MALLLLTDIAAVKDLLGQKAPATAGLDGILTDIVTATSRAIEVYLRRPLMAEQQTEIKSPKPYAMRLFCDAFPVDASQGLTITEAADRNYAAGDVKDPADYYVDEDSGIIDLDNELLGGPGTVQLIYFGGLATTTDSLRLLYPDIAEAATFWAKEVFEKRNKIGRSGESQPGVSVSWQDGLGDMPKVVKGWLEPHRKVPISA